MTSAGAPIGALKEYLYVPLPTVSSLLGSNVANLYPDNNSLHLRTTMIHFAVSLARRYAPAN